ncbi:hypothetical protein BDZ91DRAFT_762610 [Kalaharituber pfeilii]|nr:hypothetical protein BDZ91DRAFT_762610 [Kalaharituber pfeilii]
MSSYPSIHSSTPYMELPQLDSWNSGATTAPMSMGAATRLSCNGVGGMGEALNSFPYYPQQLQPSGSIARHIRSNFQLPSVNHMPQVDPRLDDRIPEYRHVRSAQSSPIDRIGDSIDEIGFSQAMFPSHNPAFNTVYQLERDPPNDISKPRSASADPDSSTRSKAFVRKSRTGHVYTVCPKQEYHCQIKNCSVVKNKACDMKDHYYTAHAQFNCMQCDGCGNSYARPCTYKRHLRDDKTCPKQRTLNAEQRKHGEYRRRLMHLFSDMTNIDNVREGVKLIEMCNKLPEMRKRKRRTVANKRSDQEDIDEDYHEKQQDDQCMGACDISAPMTYPINSQILFQPPGFNSPDHDYQYWGVSIPKYLTRNL